MRDDVGVSGGDKIRRADSPLKAFGRLDTCRNVMRAYDLYRYNLYKEKYETHGKISKQLGRAE
ncbi:hypothetical protein [Anaerocaecibacter muris]|uniref:hypothetical protein n=1 Tax=Anaerocaecibacter muris TaxID=2941513 RepID=UPI0020407F32|nr:hypothetical protein [Anaerocaecibacter muris]